MVSTLAGPEDYPNDFTSACRTVVEVIESDLDAKELLINKKHQNIDETTRLIDNS